MSTLPEHFLDFLEGALGSARQMTDSSVEFAFAQSYDPGVYPEPAEGGSFN